MPEDVLHFKPLCRSEVINRGCKFLRASLFVSNRNRLFIDSTIVRIVELDFFFICVAICFVAYPFFFSIGRVIHFVVFSCFVFPFNAVFFSLFFSF